MSFLFWSTWTPSIWSQPESNLQHGRVELSIRPFVVLLVLDQDEARNWFREPNHHLMCLHVKKTEKEESCGNKKLIKHCRGGEIMEHKEHCKAESCSTTSYLGVGASLAALYILILLAFYFFSKGKRPRLRRIVSLQASKPWWVRHHSIIVLQIIPCWVRFAYGILIPATRQLENRWSITKNMAKLPHRMEW